MAKAPKRHHFIPQMILRQFADGDGYLWFYDKRQRMACVGRARPDRLFVQNYVYSQINDDGSRDPSLEKDLAEIEGAIAPLLKRLVNSARTRSNPRLTRTERELLDLFFYIQWKRMPEFHDEVVGDINDWMNVHIAEFERDVRPLTSEERASLTDPEWLATVRHNTLVDSVRTHGRDVIEKMRTMGLGIAVIADSTKSFVIGSTPIVQHRRSANSGEIWLPISHDVAIGPYGPEPQGITMRSLRDISEIRRINAKICAQSNLVAGRSARLLCSLTGAVQRRSPE